MCNSSFFTALRTLLVAASVAWFSAVSGCASSKSMFRWMSPAKASTTVAAEEPLDERTVETAQPAGEFRTSPTGLRYRIIDEGSGRTPLPSSTVMVHYRGWLDDGTEFDSSYKRNKPATFPLKGVVAGWTEGLQLIAKGGKIELEVPSNLGYGARGMPPTIPGGATLHFEIKLLDVQ